MSDKDGRDPASNSFSANARNPLLPDPRHQDGIVGQSAAMLARRIGDGDLSSREVVEAHIRRIEAVNANLNAVVITLFEPARKAAEKADAARSRGDKLRPLHGVPFTVKECFHVAGTPSCIGIERFRNENIPGDGPLVRRLKAAGGILLGKTNVPQAMLLHETENPVYGQTNNPWDVSRSAGGSSGGEAAIIAAGGSPLGLANDLGGSIRQPAHVCGVAGIKPTAGRFTNRGCRNNISGLQLITTQSGVIAHTAEDLILAVKLLHHSTSDAIREEDESDSPLGDPAAVELKSLRVGVFQHDGYFQPSPAICRAVSQASDRLASLGVETVAFTPPTISAAMSLYFALIGADGARSISELLEGGSIDWRLARLIRIGQLTEPWRKMAAATAAVFGQPRSAQMLRATGKKTADQMAEMGREIDNYAGKFLRAMDELRIDAILCPPYGLAAPPHGSTLYLTPAASYCFLANLLRMPAGVVPITTVRTGEERRTRSRVDLVERAASQVEAGSVGLPVGVQILARSWREDVVLALLGAVDHTRSQVR